MSTKLTYFEDRVTASPDIAQGMVERRMDSRPPAQAAYELIELLFFAYRDFVGDPDRILGDLGFGRAHHRVIHFVARRPGLSVADLLDLLQITKQSLNRVLKELVDKGYVEGRIGIQDRRQRLLYPTEAGCELSDRLVRIQTRRIRRALGTDPDGELEEAARRFLGAMIDRPERCGVRAASGSDKS